MRRVMFDDGVDNAFEAAHQRGLTRGFDLGWSYKGRFDRALIKDLIKDMSDDEPKVVDKIEYTEMILSHLREHDSNREFVTY